MLEPTRVYRRWPGARWPGASQAVAGGGDPVAALPPLPVTFARSDDGGSTIRAVRLTVPITIDGRLDEEVYRTIQPASGFIQQEPASGQPATEDTDVWVLFDTRRDGNNVYLNDTVTFILDTFHDGRTGFFFQTNLLGALRDGFVVSESVTNYDWNTVWDVRTRQDEGGWTVETAIPFKSLRYPQSESQVWGFNLRRVLRGRNEDSLLAPVPRSFVGIWFAENFFGIAERHRHECASAPYTEPGVFYEPASRRLLRAVLDAEPYRR